MNDNLWKSKEKNRAFSPYLVFSLIRIMRWLVAAKETDENTEK